MVAATTCWDVNAPADRGHRQLSNKCTKFGYLLSIIGNVDGVWAGFQKLVHVRKVWEGDSLSTGRFRISGKGCEYDLSSEREVGWCRQEDRSMEHERTC